MVVRNIGLDVQPPKKTCEDRSCPFHGILPVRGKVIAGVVMSAKMKKTAVVGRDYLHFSRKYMRYEKRRSRILAHNPPCLEVKEGDKVMIAECRPVSKEVAFVIVQKT